MSPTKAAGSIFLYITSWVPGCTELKSALPALTVVSRRSPFYNLTLALSSLPCSLPLSLRSILLQGSSSWHMKTSHTSSTSRSVRAKSLHHSSQFWTATSRSGLRTYCKASTGASLGIDHHTWFDLVRPHSLSP